MTDHKKYLLFVDYGLEGWRIVQEADDPQPLLDRIQSGQYGPWLIVKVLDVTIEEKREG